jgi:hypothetical protein
MKDVITFVDIPAFGGNASKSKPADPKYANGWIPDERLPAENENYFIAGLTGNGVTEQAGINNLITELKNLLALDAATVPDPNTSTQIATCVTNLLAANLIISGWTEKTTVVDDDLFFTNDSVSPYAKKRMKFSTMKNNIINDIVGAQIIPNLIENLVINSNASSITISAGLMIRVTSGIYTFGSDTTPSLATVDGVIGTGYGWCAVCINETTGAISVQLLGAGVPAFAAASTLGIAIGNTKDTENQLALLSVYDNSLGYCRSRINATGDYYRIIAVFKRILGYTNATVDSTNASYAMACDSTALLTIGMQISQAGAADIPAGAEIVEITSATAFRINILETGTHTNISMVIASNVSNIVKVLKKPVSFVKLYNNIIQSAPSAALTLASIEFDLNSEISGTTTARVFTAVNQKNLDLMFGAQIMDDSAAIRLYKNGNVYKNTTITGGGDRPYFSYNENIALISGGTLQIKITSSYEINNASAPRSTQLIIKERTE